MYILLAILCVSLVDGSMHCSEPASYGTYPTRYECERAGMNVDRDLMMNSNYIMNWTCVKEDD